MFRTDLRNLSTQDTTLQVQHTGDKYYLLTIIHSHLADKTEISQDTYYQLLTEDINYNSGYTNAKQC